MRVFLWLLFFSEGCLLFFVVVVTLRQPSCRVLVDVSCEETSLATLGEGGGGGLGASGRRQRRYYSMEYDPVGA